MRSAQSRMPLTEVFWVIINPLDSFIVNSHRLQEINPETFHLRGKSLLFRGIHILSIHLLFG